MRAAHCSAQKAVILYGNIGIFTAGYAGCASTGGHPGFAFNGTSDVARTWTSAGFGRMTADDQSHATCP